MPPITAPIKAAQNSLDENERGEKALQMLRSVVHTFFISDAQRST